MLMHTAEAQTEIYDGPHEGEANVLPSHLHKEPIGSSAKGGFFLRRNDEYSRCCVQGAAESERLAAKGEEAYVGCES